MGGAQQGARDALAALEKVDENSDQGVETLRGLLIKEAPAVRLAALEALIASTNKAAALGVLEAVTDAHPAVARRAGDVLLNHERGHELFNEAFEQDAPRLTRGAARLWPVWIGRREDRIAALGNALESTDALTRFMLFATSCSPELLELAKDRTDLASRAGLELCALASTANRLGGTAPTLLQLLVDEDPDLRTHAAYELYRVARRLDDDGKAQALAALDRASRSPDAATSIAVHKAQAALGNGDAVSSLAIWVRAGDTDTRLPALAALSELGQGQRRLRSPTLTGALEQAYGDADEETRVLAARVAGMTQDGRVTAPLTQLLGDPAPRVRAAAAYALGVSSSKLAVGTLLDIAVQDTDKTVRDACYATLHHLVHGHALPPAPFVGEWLSDPGDVGELTFWGRDFELWRRWYQEGR